MTEDARTANSAMPPGARNEEAYIVLVEASKAVAHLNVAWENALRGGLDGPKEWIDEAINQAESAIASAGVISFSDFST